MNKARKGMAPEKSNESGQSEPSNTKSTMSGMGSEMAEVGNMDKIRDILFGNQAKDYEKRFIRMENQLTQEARELKEELLKRIDSLEVYFKQEMKDINDRIKNESNERADSQKNIQTELKEVFESLTKKLLQEEENLAKKSTELRDQILEQSKQLTAEILSKSDHASSNLRQTARELDDAKVNRSDLSGFFLDLAMRLSGDDGMGLSGNLKE
jgi:DNA anti-recombination protein RmuC